MATSIDWPSASVTIAFFTSLWRPTVPRKRFSLALAQQRVHRRHLDAEQRLDGSLDLRLRRLAGDVEDDLVLLGSHGRLFGDGRADDHVVVAKVSHLKRSSSASTAAFERTSVPRRRMS